MEEFLEQGIVAVGWPMLSDLAGANRDDLKAMLRKEYPDRTNRSLGMWAGQLHRFVNKMEPGDWVVAPDGDTVFIGKIASDYTFNPEVAGGTYRGEDAGYPHQRKVEWSHERKGVKRSKATGKLYDALKSRLTVFELPAKDAQDLEDRGHFVPEDTKDQLQEAYFQKLRGRNLPGMNSNVFEDAVRTVLRRHFPGLSREATFSDDKGDTDLLTELPGDVTVRIQVKYYDPKHGPVKPRDVEQLADSMEPNDNGIIVTSGDIGEEAKQRATGIWENNRKDIAFIDGQEFVDLVFDSLAEYDDDELVTLALRRIVDLP